MRVEEGQLKHTYPCGLITRLQPHRQQPEGLKGFYGRLGKLLVSGNQRVQLLLDHALQFPHNAEVWVDVAFYLLVPDHLTIQAYLETAVRTRSQGNPDIRSKRSEKFVGHPRGRSVVLSGHAIQDIHQNFPLAVCGHVNSPYV